MQTVVRKKFLPLLGAGAGVAAFLLYLATASRDYSEQQAVLRTTQRLRAARKEPALGSRGCCVLFALAQGFASFWSQQQNSLFVHKQTVTVTVIWRQEIPTAAPLSQLIARALYISEIPNATSEVRQITLLGKVFLECHLTKPAAATSTATAASKPVVVFTSSIGTQ
jgi:hypothetical protein